MTGPSPKKSSCATPSASATYEKPPKNFYKRLAKAKKGATFAPAFSEKFIRILRLKRAKKVLLQWERVFIFAVRSARNGVCETPFRLGVRL